MIRGVRIAENFKPTLMFIRDWADAMAVKKLADPTLIIVPLPKFLEIVDREGRASPRFVQLAQLFTPSLQARQPIADADGFPTDYALGWWAQAT